MNLKIINLHVEAEDKEIIKNVSLTLQSNQVYVLMGPNGSGKSTLVNAIMGNPKYKITAGKLLLDGRDLTFEKPDVRSKLGLFLSFQYPQEISGVSISTFLRTAVNARRENKYSVIEFHQLLKDKMQEFAIDSSFSKRDLNAGFSGGEKKRMEMLQLALLEPRFALLDETDSGLDVDAIKLVAENIKRIKAKTGLGVLLITHYQKFLEFLQPDVVSIIYDGKIIKQGKAELAREIEYNGFEKIINSNKDLK